MQTSGCVWEAFERLTELEEDPPYKRWLHFIDWGLSYKKNEKESVNKIYEAESTSVRKVGRQPWAFSSECTLS